MTIHLSREIEEQLRQLADARGLDVEELAQEAVRQYLVICSMNDVSAEEIAQSQAQISRELPGWNDQSTDSTSEAP